MTQWIVLFCGGLAVTAVADTGPEYLEGTQQPDPAGAGFILLKLPFEEARKRHVNIRTFYQNRDFNRVTDREDFAGGGLFSAVGSYWNSQIKIGVTAFTSQKLYADNNKADTGSLQLGHHSYSALGEFYASLTLDKVAIQAGRYALNIPYINEADIRMLPQTFQGAQIISKLTQSWTAGGGVLTDIKSLTSTGFDSMYESAGLEKDNEVYIGGSIYQWETGSQWALYAIHATDYHSNIYFELTKRFSLNENNALHFAGQYTQQQSTGEALDGDFNIDHYGARMTWKARGYSASIAYTDYPDQERIRTPWGSSPGYTSIMINDFDRSKESALLFGGTVDLDPVGVPGGSVNIKYVIGETPDCGNSASPDRNETDINFKYSPVFARLTGLVFQLRFAWLREQETCLGNDADDINEIRFVMNYGIDF
jgi:outer membrane porin, OprD family